MEDSAPHIRNDFFEWEPEQQLDFWLVLHKMSGLGCQKLQQLSVLCDGKLEYLAQLTTKQFQQLGLPYVSFAEALTQFRRYIDSVREWVEQSDLHSILTINHPGYPERLRQISSAPLILFCKGNSEILAQPQIAIVGSRNHTPAGSKVSHLMAQELVASGWTVTSGLALGIDTYAHRGALQGNGFTVAVMATGIDKIYPKRNQKLADDIIQQKGCLVTEFPIGSEPKREHFPRRNRIISGLSNGVLVVEAALKSGSLITARYALEQNREVFAVPGSVYNLSSQGCHYLIKQGAKLVEQVTDINEEFPNLKQIALNSATNQAEKKCKISLATDKLLASVGFEATPLDVVAQRSGLPVTAVMSELLEYELRGLVATVPGGYIRLGE